MEKERYFDDDGSHKRKTDFFSYTIKTISIY